MLLSPSQNALPYTLESSAVAPGVGGGVGLWALIVDPKGDSEMYHL